MPLTDRTENAGAIVEVETGRRVEFDLNPEPIEDEKETEFASIPIPGMSHPKIQFTGGGERVLSFSVFLHYGATGDVPSAIRQLQAWQYAEYSNGRLTKGPPRLLVVFGSTWPDEPWVIRSCRVTRQRFDKQLNCVYAEAAIELIQFIDESIDAKDVRGA